MANIRIKWQLCQPIAHLSPNEQAIALFLSANHSKEKVKLPPYLIKRNYSQLAAKVGKLRKAQVALDNSEVPLFDTISYSKGAITFKFSEPIEQLLTKTGNYLFCNFEIYCRLRKKYAKAMYLLFCQFRGTGRIKKALFRLAERIGATAPSYRYLCRLRRLMDDALGQIQTHDCVEFKVTKAGDVLVIEKKDSFFEHRVHIGFIELKD